MSTLVIIWLAIFILSVVVEIISLGLTTIWFAAGALVALILAAVKLPLWIQVVAFLVVSVVLLIYTRPLAVKYFNKDRSLTNAEGLVGKNALVTEDIDNVLGKGQAIVDGQEWSARAADDSETIKKGDSVEIIAINGVKLIVKKATDYVEEV